MDKRVHQYRMLGRYEAKRLFPIPPGMLCEDCETEKATDHHHVDGDTHNNTEANIRLLCRVCHLRCERAEHHVGSRSKLTAEQIARIKNPQESITKLARELGYTPVYLQRIRTGKRNPKPIDEYIAPSAPSGFVFKDRRGKPRALTVEQVKNILSYQPVLGTKNAHRLASEFGVGIATIWKARGRQRCYADSVYD